MKLYKVIIKRTDRFLIYAESSEAAIAKAWREDGSWYASEATHQEAKEAED
jgi:hypothetical protein